MKNLSILLLSLFFFTCSKGSQAFVKRVKDGDTVVVIMDDREKVCRLYGIDAPEKSQPFGPEAKMYLSVLVLEKKLEVDIVDKDMYGRSICILNDGDKLSINERMVLLGYAWVYVQYLKKDKAELMKYLLHQKNAYELSQGLWSDENPEAPWEYRKKRKRSH